jgi:hypothetical protein
LDGWDIPTEEELEKERLEEERYYEESYATTLKGYENDYRVIKESYSMTPSERRKFIIEQYAFTNYNVFVDKGIEMSQDEIQSHLMEHLSDEVIILIQGHILLECRRNLDEIMCQLNPITNTFEMNIGKMIFDYVCDFLRQPKVTTN